jgi:hypothetical protein
MGLMVGRSFFLTQTNQEIIAFIVLYHISFKQSTNLNTFNQCSFGAVALFKVQRVCHFLKLNYPSRVVNYSQI